MSKVYDVSEGDYIPNTGSASLSWGLSSPLPTESQAPVPEAGVTVGGDSDNLYRLDNRVDVDFGDDYGYFRGYLNTGSSLPVSQMRVEHLTSRLNRDIRTLPVLPEPLDSSGGRRVIVGALRHWSLECGLNEDGVSGDLLLAMPNYPPAVAYYDHPTKRFVGTNVPSLYENQWRNTAQATADAGADLGVGKSVTLLSRLNFLFGSSGYPATLNLAATQVNFSSGTTVFVNGEDIPVSAYIRLDYVYSERRVRLYEGDSSGNSSSWSAVLTKNETPKWLKLVITRTSVSQVTYKIDVIYADDSTAGISLITSDYNRLPVRLAVDSTELTQYMDNRSTTTRTFEGVVALYMARGEDYVIRETDSYQVSLPWTPKVWWENAIIPGVESTGWQLIHDLATTYGLVFNPLAGTLLPADEVPGIMGSTILSTTKASGVVVTASTRKLAERIEVVNYNYSTSPNISSPITLYKADSTYSVALGERQEHTIQIEDGSFIDLVQPVCVTVPQAIAAANNKNNNLSVYSVYDSDNIEVDPRSWTDGGGAIFVEPTENVGEFKLVIQAPNNDLISKETNFIISIESSIPSLIIAGIGVTAEKRTISCRTGAGRNLNHAKVGETYDNPLVSSNKVAWRVAAGISALYGAVQTEATGSYASEGINTNAWPVIRKKGSNYIPTQMNASAGILNVSSSVRFNSMSTFINATRSLNCAEANAKYAGYKIRDVNISPLGKDNY